MEAVLMMAAPFLDVEVRLVSGKRMEIYSSETFGRAVLP